MKYLFDDIQTIYKHIHARNKVILLSDYDGTLTAICEHPDLAILPEKVRELLKKLTSHHKFLLGIVTGRSIQQIKEFVNIRNIVYAANYGAELEGPEMRFTNPEAKKSRYILWHIYLRLLKSLRHIEGVYIEDKGLSISLHYRLVKKIKDLQHITKVFYSITKPFLDKEMISLDTGKMVYEIRSPVKSNKASIVTWLLVHYFPLEFQKDALLIYLGDDKADIEVFTVLRGKALTIFVGDPSVTSEADYFIHSPKEVEVFLEYLYEQKVHNL